MTDYAPDVLSTNKAAIMEPIRASVCVTSVISVALVKRYRGNITQDEAVGINQYRMSTRGSAKSSPMPWEQWLQQSHSEKDLHALGTAVDQPRTGDRLTNMITALLKTADSHDKSKNEPGRLDSSSCGQT